MKFKKALAMVLVVAGENEGCVERALRVIKVDYERLPALLDFRKAKDHPVVIHPEENWKSLCSVGADNKRNLCASGRNEKGDVERVLFGGRWPYGAPDPAQPAPVGGGADGDYQRPPAVGADRGQ